MLVSNVSLSCAGCSAGGGDGGAGRLGGSAAPPHTLSPTGHLVVAVCLGFIGTFGFVNNAVVLVLFCRYRLLRSPINCLLVSISVSDLLVCVLGTPFSFAASTRGRWLIGGAGCVWYGFVNSFLGIVSLISLAVLSYERYCTMMGATQADSTNYRKVIMGITFSWIYSMIWTLPPLFGWSRYGPEGPGTTCSVNWAAKTANNVSYIVCLFFFCLILPFFVIVYSYGKLLQAIKQETSSTFTGARVLRMMLPPVSIENSGRWRENAWHRSSENLLCCLSWKDFQLAFSSRIMLAHTQITRVSKDVTLILPNLSPVEHL